MNKNVKRIFLVATLLILLVGVTAISASEVSYEATVLEDTSQLIAPDDVAAPTSSDDKIVDTSAKNIEKEDKNIKTSTKTVEVNNWNELQTAITTATEDSENDTYIIDLNDGTYKLGSRQFTFNAGSFSPNIIINGNDQTLEVKREGFSITLDNDCNITINDLTVNAELFSYVDLTLNNVIMEFANIENNKNMELNNVSSEWEIVNNEDSTLIIKNSELRAGISNLEGSTLIIKNSTLKGDISNVGGNVVIDDDVIFGDYFSINGGNITISDQSRIAPYLTELYGDNILENTEINHELINYGNLVIRNCFTTEYFEIKNNGNLTIEDLELNSLLTNNGTLTLKNTTVNKYLVNFNNLTLINTTVNEYIGNNGNLTIADDVIFGVNFGIAGDGQIISNNTNLLPYLSTLNGTYCIENQFTNLNQNYGNVTIRNSTLTYNYIDNYGNLTIEDSILDKQINNYGNLTLKNAMLKSRITQSSYNATINIADDVTMMDDFSIISTNNRLGTVIINDYSRIFKYMDVFEYEATVDLGN